MNPQNYNEDLHRRLAADAQRKEEQEFVARQLDSARKTILQKFLTKDARQRLANVKVAHPALAEQVELALLNAVQTGDLREQIDDAKLRAILDKVNTDKKEFKLVK